MTAAKHTAPPHRTSLSPTLRRTYELFALRAKLVAYGSMPPRHSNGANR